MKKQNNKWYILLPLLILGAVACEKEIPYEGEEGDPKLVVNAIFENDSIMRVEVARSFFFLDDYSVEETWITKGALIRVTDKTTGLVYEQTTPEKDNIYRIPLNVISGHTYRIDVSHTTFPSVFSEAVAPAKVLISQIKEEAVVVSGEDRIKATLTFNDPSGKNYYTIRAYMHDTVQKGRYPLALYCRDAAFPGAVEDPLDEEFPSEEIDLLDETFNGQSKSVEVSYDAFNASLQNTIIEFEFLHVDESVYKYHLSLSKGNNGDVFLGEPVKIYNNIEGGFGIFGGYNRHLVK